MIRGVLEGLIMAAVFLLLALPAVGTKRRGWIGVVAVLSFLYATLLFVPLSWPPLRAINGNWNELGKGFTITITAVTAIVLIRSGSFRSTDLGLTFAQASGTGRSILFAILPFLVIVAILTWFLSAPGGLPGHEQIAFEATLPGLDEELFFRGVMLALFDRMFPGKKNVFGAQLGYGAIATSLVFGLIHGISIDKHLNVAFFAVPAILAGLIGLVLTWIRLRTRSLLLPILTHNAVNLLLDLIPVLH